MLKEKGGAEMKRRNLSILLAYGVPWAFLALFGDAVYRWAWHYVLIFACMAMLAWLGVKTDGILLAGNALSLGCTKENPRLCRGEKKALAESKEIKRIPQ